VKKHRHSPTPAQVSSLRALSQKYGVVLRQHTDKSGVIILHCQRPHEASAKLFRIHKDGLTEAV
jgi:hypothetical protein